MVFLVLEVLNYSLIFLTVALYIVNNVEFVITLTHLFRELYDFLMFSGGIAM